MTERAQLNEAFLTQAAETYNFRLGLPTPLAIARDGAVIFARTGPRAFAADLYELDGRSGEVRVLATADGLLAGGQEQLSEAEKARRERTRTATRGITYAELSSDGRTVLIPLGERVFLLDRASGAARELALGEGFPFDPQLSPDGAHVAFVRDGDLWVIGTEPGAQPRRVTARPPHLEYGCAEFAAQEELSRTRGYWWATDGAHLLFQRTDARPVDTLYVADARHPEKAPVAFKYPRAGTANAVVDLGLVAIGAEGEDGVREPRWITWDLARWPYLAAVRWPARGALSLVVLDREQYEIAVLAVDAERGEVKTLLCERDSAWINLPAGAPAWLADGSGFLWMTEAKGAWTLELHAADGAHLRSITAPSFGLSALVGVSGGAADGVAFVEASADPVEMHLWRVPLDGSAPEPLTREPGVHGAVARHGAAVVMSARWSGGATTTLLTSEGKAHELPAVNETPSLRASTEIVELAVDGVALYASITRPRDFDPARRYPVLLKVYAGPHRQFVTRARDGYAMDQLYADTGFIVLRCDGRGTPQRGRQWERATLRDLISVPLADQIGALRAAAARFPELDLDRVGVYGWSFGGYFAAMAVLRHPEIFKAAVAGAPVTDWALYDTAYTERYMKLPSNNPEGYRATSALHCAAGLSRPLLLIHGTTDDNVHFAHTLALLEALYVAGKRAEVIALSGTHMVPDPRLGLARERAHVEFFRAHLA